MGVTAKSTNKKGDGRVTLLVVLLVLIGVPFLTIKYCTASPKKTASQPAAAETVASQNENTAASNTTDASTTGTSDSAVTADHSSSDNDTVETDNGFRTASSYHRTYAKDKNGVYELSGPVMDTASVLSESEYNELDSYLRNLDKNTGVQIAVLTVSSLDGEDINTYSMKHAEAWKLGQKGVDNGALLTVAMAEHDVRIETGYGTEGTLTDAKCAQIIRNVIVPAFKNGDYGKGIISGVENMAGIITKDDSLVTIKENGQLEESNGTSDAASGIIFVLFFIFFILIIVISSIQRALHPFSHRGMWINTGSHNDTHFGGFGGGGGGGGGFSGGGGGFGGGGASGHW